MTGKTSVPARVDSKEPLDFALTVGNHPEVETWSVESLPVGDLLVAERVLIERKTVSDFTSSLTEGRLKDQARRLAETGYSCYVLVEGDMADYGADTHSNVKKASLVGASASIMEREGIPVIPCSDQETLVDLAVRLGRKAVEPDDASLVRGTADLQNASPTLRMYASIPKVGPERARTLEAAYPTAAALLRASKDDIEALDGFGPELAETVYCALRFEGGVRP